MSVVNIILMALGLAMDAAAVSMAAAASGFAGNRRAVFRLAFHFGLFQAMMPVLGWFMGVGFVSYFKAFDHWVAFGLLAFVGGRMIISGLDRSQDVIQKDPSKGMTMVMLSLATSIDALAVGLSLAMIHVSIWYPAVIIGVITSALSVVAIRIGKRLGAMFGKNMEILGGLILVGIGTRILVSQLMAGT